MNYVYQDQLDFKSRVGVALGSFAPLHKGHLDMIYKAKKECAGGVIVVVCGYKGDKGEPLMSLQKRYQMVREFFKNDPLVAVYCLSDDEMGIAGQNDQWDIWLKHLEEDIICDEQHIDLFTPIELKQKLIFYVGEKEYSNELNLRGYDVVLLDRNNNPISATMIRENPLKYWENIAWTYHRVFSHNILITGTASEGKTTLVEDIGRYFNIPFSYEWARSYIDKHCIGDWEFNCSDFLAFLVGQFNHNRDCIESVQNKGIFISDTDSLVTKMYAKYYAMDNEFDLTIDEYEKVLSPVADEFVKKSKWDKIFVVVPKGKFVDDHTRYMRHGSMEARNELIDILLEEIRKSGLEGKVEILDGGYESNFNKVKNYIKGVQTKK